MKKSIIIIMLTVGLMGKVQAGSILGAIIKLFTKVSIVDTAKVITKKITYTSNENNQTKKNKK